MLQDEHHYPDPSKFKPERFLGENGQLDPKVRDPGNIAFGFGRRYAIFLFTDLDQSIMGE